MIIDSYLRKEILRPFIYALTILVFVLLLGRLFKIVNMVVAEGVSLGDVAALVLALIPKIMTMALPMAFFFAVLAGLGRLVGDGEFMALQAAGVAPRRLLSPVLKLAVAATLLTLMFTGWLSPWGMRQVHQVTFSILQEKITVALKERALNLSFPGMAIYLEGINHHNGQVDGVFIEDRRRPDKPQTVTAVRGRLVGDRASSSLVLQLEDGTIHEYDSASEVYRVTDFSQYRINFEISDLLGDEGRLRLRNNALDNRSLWQRLNERLQQGENPSGLRIALYERFTQPLACLAFALIGFALSLSPVRSGARFRGFVYGLIIILAYYVSSLIAEYLSEWQPFFTCLFFLLPNVFFLLLGIWLFRRQTA